MTASRTDVDARADLEEQRDFLLGSLDDLEREHEAGDIDDDDYRALKDDYTARAAAVLRALDGGRDAVPVVADAPAAGRPRRAVLWGALVAIVAVAAGLLVANASGARLPGESSSGDIRETSGQKLADAATLFERGDVLESLKLLDEVLDEDPDSVPAITYKGWVLANVGSSGEQPELLERGEAMLAKAVEMDPTYAEAHFFYGYVLLRARDDREGALEQFRLVLENDPPPSLEGPATMVVNDLESGGDGIPDS